MSIFLEPSFFEYSDMNASKKYYMYLYGEKEISIKIKKFETLNFTNDNFFLR